MDDAPSEAIDRLAQENNPATPPPIPYTTLQQWKADCHSLSDPFLSAVPKIELHLHIEGTLSPSLRYRLAQKHNLLPIYSARLNKDFHTLSELETAYNLLRPRSIKGKGISAFFEAYYGGMEVLLDEDDFFELAMEYFERAKEMGVRYAEIMFDIQAHTRRGVPIETVLSGLERAKVKADEELNIKSSYISCFLRDLPLESAIQHYELLRPFHHHLITGIGLDSNEYLNPPSKFYSLYTLARSEGLKLTCHCDVAQPSTLANIHTVLTSLGGDAGADRIDHGLDAAQDPSLVAEIVRRGTGMTLCPWAYVRHHREEDLVGWMRKLIDEGVRVSIGSDSPAYTEGNYLLANLKLLKLRVGFTNEEFVGLMKGAVEICWAGEEVKRGFSEELEAFWEVWEKRNE